MMTQPPRNVGGEDAGGAREGGRPQRYFRHRKKFRRDARQREGAPSTARGLSSPSGWKRRGDFQARRKRVLRRQRTQARRRRVKKAPPEPRLMSLARALGRLKDASRAIALQLIREGRVQVNGETILEPNTQVRIHRDTIVVDGIELTFPPVEQYTVVFHKPRHVSGSKELGMPTVYEYLPKRRGGYFPCGRLTKFASGLVIFSSDPAYRNPERSPLSLVEKEYHVKVHRHVERRELEQLTEELRRMSQYNAQARVELLQENSRTCWLRIVARQLPLAFLHRLLKGAKLEILHLHRYRLGFLTTDSLPAGAWRRLRAEELAKLEEDVPRVLDTVEQKAPAWYQLHRWLGR
ncbi:MAG: S4 domain-containing protein [Chlorobiota bacterium]